MINVIGFTAVALLAIGMIALVIWMSDKCTWCGARMEKHEKHWNMMVCPRCGKVKVND